MVFKLPYPPHGALMREVLMLICATGGYPKFVSQGLNDNYLPIWMQAEGYNTFYTGKLMNYHTILNWNDPLPRGWTAHDCKFE